MSDFTGIWLTAEVLAIDDLNLTEKVLASQVLMLSRSGECTAQNPHLARQIGLTTTSISQTLKSLRLKGYICIEDGKEQGNKRQMYPSLKLLQTLCKNLTEGWSGVSQASVKILKSLYKILTEATQDSYTPYVKILHTLFKNFTELYIRNENKDESKIESKEKKRRTVSRADALTPFWSILSIPFSDYKNWLAAEQKKIYVAWPPCWTPAMIDAYRSRWLPFRQNGKTSKKKLQAASIQEQINELAPLSEAQLTACITHSISNGYQGLFPEKFKRNGKPLNSRPQQVDAAASTTGRYEFDLESELAKRANGYTSESGVTEGTFEIVD